MDNVQKYIVIVDIDKEACPWLKDTVVKVGAIVTETSDFYGCCGPGGTLVEGGGLECPTELPTAALSPLADDEKAVDTVLN